MRRAVIISAIVVAGLFAAALLAVLAMLHTPPGRSFIKSIIESELGGALNSRAEIGALNGALPGHIILEDVVLSDVTGPWLTAQRLELRWRPVALIGKRLVIDEVSLQSAHLLRDPPKSDGPKDDARQIKILDALPRIDIGNLAISDFDVTVGGALQRLNASGSVRLDGAAIGIDLKVTSSGGGDEVDVAFTKSPDTERYKLDATVNAEAGGAIASLLDLHGPTTLSAQSDSPVNEAVTTIKGNVGYYGDINAVIKSDFAGFNGADLTILFTPGARFDGIEELAAPVTLDARYDARDRGGSLTIAQLTSAIGDISGKLDWLAPRGFIERLTADLNTRLNEPYQPELQEIAGSDLSVKAKLDWRRDDYALDAVITGPLATLTITKGATDLRQHILGDAVLDAAARDDGAFWLASGLKVEGKLIADLKQEIVLNTARLTTGDGSRFTGDGGYELETKSLRAKGDVILTPGFAGKILTGATPTGEIAGDLDLTGPLDRFTLKAAFETPAFNINERSLPPMSVEASLAGLPRLPTGDISARASNGAPRRLDVQLRSSEDGTIRIPALSYGGRGFTLDGSAQINPDRQTLNLDLAYQGDDAAEPWPGVIAAGDLTTKGVLSRDGALNRMNAAAGALKVNGFAATGATLTAEGPPGAIRVKLTADMFTSTQTGDIAEISTSGQVDARADPKIRLNALTALIRENRVRLTEPAQFSFANGVDITNLRLAYGADGAIAIDGGFSPERWRAEAAFANVNIPDADGQITGKLSLDTDAKTPATGEFHLRSLLLSEDQQASIRGRAVWNGEFVQLTDLQDDKTLDMDIRLPAQLIKSPTINVDTDGALSGKVKYHGDVQALAAYLPPVLQSLEGALAAEFTLAGSLASPDFSGRAALTGGAYTEIESGFSLAGLHAQAEADYGGANSTVTFKGGARGAGQSQEDTLTFTGDLTLGGAPNVNFSAKLDQAEFSASPINKVRANGEMTVSGPLDALIAKGDISVLELDAEIVTPETTGLVDIDVIAVNDAGNTPETPAPPRKSSLDFEIRLHADSRIFIRGRGLESEWSADVTAIDGREEPLILGSLSLRRGWLDFSGRRFDLTRGSIAFDRLAVNNPRLDIRAELQTSDGVTAIIAVTGRAQEPKIELTSTPLLPSEDVMSLILFGKPAQTLSAFESLQTAEALASLGGIGPFGGEGITGRLRRSVGLDLLNVDIDPANGGGSLTVGKYVADGFFVSASQDAQGRSGSVSVKYEITDNITVETEIEQTGDQTVSANWKKDF